jgi:hypothetical protein
VADLGFFYDCQRPYASADLISPPCWAVVIPQDPTREQDLTPDSPWPRNPKSRNKSYLARSFSVFLFSPPFWHFLLHSLRYQTCSDPSEKTRQLVLGKFLFRHVIIFIHRGYLFTYFHLSLGRVEGRKDPEDFPRIRTA